MKFTVYLRDAKDHQYGAHRIAIIFSSASNQVYVTFPGEVILFALRIIRVKKSEANARNFPIPRNEFTALF